MANIGFGKRATIAEVIEMLSKVENQNAVLTLSAPNNGETECFTIDEYDWGVEIQLNV